MDQAELARRIPAAAFAFRGFNVTNLGRTSELLAHPAYGPVVRRHLEEASEIHAEATGQKINLVARVRQGRETTLRTYSQALSLIVAAELAQLELAEQFHGIRFSEAALCFGYSLGEATALIAGGVYRSDAVLLPPLALARDCARLAGNVKMGIVFSRGPELDLEPISRMCLEISARGRGTLGISSLLSPNTLLVLGQKASLNRLKRRVKDELPRGIHVRNNPDRWPPLHTPIVRQLNVPDRSAVMLESLPGGFCEPAVPVLSCVTGDFGYSATNSREILRRWVDEPQRLWNVMQGMLEAGVETVINVGPQPNIIPSTLSRLKSNVSAQLEAGGLAGLGLKAVSQLVARRTWLVNLLTENAVLLRALHVEQLNLEDWLLEQNVP